MQVRQGPTDQMERKEHQEPQETTDRQVPPVRLEPLEINGLMVYKELQDLMVIKESKVLMEQLVRPARMVQRVLQVCKVPQV